MQSPRQKYWQKLNIVYNSLLKPERWYTGLSIKQYLRQKVFNLSDGQFANKPINAGRWSAYAHYSMLAAFDNLLEKHEIDQTKTVLVHPLLPPELVDKLIQRGAKLATLDISKSTLAIPSRELLNYVRLMKATGLPDLVILYDLSGLLKDATESAKELQRLTIPTLVFVDAPYVHAEFLDLCEQLELGSVLWNAGPSFLDEQLDSVTQQTLEPLSWYISWFIETRSRSVLEYHLRDSQDIFRPLLEAYFFLLLKKYETLDWRGKLFYTPAGNRIFLKQGFKSAKEAESQLLQSYNSLQNRAISDVVFDLQLKSEEQFETANIQDVHHQELYWRQQSKRLYEFLVAQIPVRPQGSLEVPDFYVDRSYVWQYFLSTDPESWKNYFQNLGWLVDGYPPIHPNFAGKANLTNAAILSRYGVGLNIPMGLQNPIT